MPREQPDRPFRVLLVEDDESHAFMVKEALLACPVPNECALATDGLEALEMLRAGQPDLILMDLNLPRVDGRATLVALKQDQVLRRIPVIVLTTSTNPRDIDECYAHGAASYIAKPIELEDLFAAMDRTMTFWCTVVQLPGNKTLKA